jgi:outer membrane protein insertion porin family/translocation and assembly module TamA
MGSRRVAALVRCALVAIGLGLLVPAIARAQDVLCDHGEREVSAVRFEGNTTFSADELSARVLSTPSSSIRHLIRVPGVGRRRCYPDIGLQNDILNLRTFYRNYGFYDTQVDTAVVTIAPQRVDIVFRITEGPPLILDSLAIVGLDSVPERDRILRDSVVKVGQRVGPLLVAAQIDTITNRLRNNGYPKATIFQAFDTHAAEHLAELTLTVQPGARAHFGNIAVNGVGVTGGPAHIDSSVVLGLLGFRPGDLYSETAIINARRHLYDLAVYRHVDVTVDSTWTHGDSVADVVLDLREDYFKQVDTDFGWGQVDCFKVNATYTDKNFQNQARRLDLTARLWKLGYAKKVGNDFTRSLCYTKYLDADSTLGSSKLNDYFGATIRYPTLFGRPFTPAFSIYTERQSQYQAYLRSTDIGFDLSATREVARQTPFRIGYTFEHGATQADPLVLCAIFSRCTLEERNDATRRLRLGIASASIQRTRTDNLVAPTRGYSTAVELRYSAPFLASDDELRFYKGTAEYSIYRTLQRGVIFAARARGGFIHGGDEQNGNRLPPPQERLYAGGPTTVRGFQQNQLGPQVYLLDDAGVTICTDVTQTPCPAAAETSFVKIAGDTTNPPFYIQSNGRRQLRSIPSGGNVLAVFNAELRIRDPFFTELLEYIPFVDAGQVWITQVSREFKGQSQLAVTPGLGIRYYSPVGPVQLNLGYNRYNAVPGAAYYTVPVNIPGRPLLCVAPAGAPLSAIPIITRDAEKGSLNSTSQTCPAYSPPGRGGFFHHINLTLSIGTDF